MFAKMMIICQQSTLVRIVQIAERGNNIKGVNDNREKKKLWILNTIMHNLRKKGENISLKIKFNPKSLAPHNRKVFGEGLH